jgi:hypothetical protein
MDPVWREIKRGDNLTIDISLIMLYIMLVPIIVLSQIQVNI